MRISTDRIVSTHVGSLPRPDHLISNLQAKDAGRAYDRTAFDRDVASSIHDIVDTQARLGIDIVNDGEHSKSSFASYGRMRLSGIVDVAKPLAYRGPTRDSLAFPGAYAVHAKMNSARLEGGSLPPQRRTTSAVCAGPVKYAGHADVALDIANLKKAIAPHQLRDAFITAISPTNLEMYHPNEYYRSDEEYLEALANAMNEEYRAIVEAGFILQIDDPRLATHYNRTPTASIEECRRFMALRVEAVNLSLKNIPRDKVRLHTCYSVNVAPRVHDWELRHYIDLLLCIDARAFTFEAANPRHEHEWVVWRGAQVQEVVRDVLATPKPIITLIQTTLGLPIN